MLNLKSNFLKIYSTTPMILKKWIPQNNLKTNLFMIDAVRMDAPKWHSTPHSKKVALSVKQLSDSVKNNSIV